MTADTAGDRGSRIDDLPAAGLVRARAWDVLGAALGAPMIVWGLLSWFGVAGDEGGGVPGFFSGAGAAAIGLVLAASGHSLNQILSGRPHDTPAPPVSAFFAGAAAIVVLGAMIAKPDSSTIQAGSVAGLVTAAVQAAVLTVGWTKGAGKTIQASRVQALDARLAGAERLAKHDLAQAGFANRQQTRGSAPAWNAPQPQYGQPQFGQPVVWSGQPPGWPGQPPPAGWSGQPLYGPPQGWPGPSQSGSPSISPPPGWPAQQPSDQPPHSWPMS